MDILWRCRICGTEYDDCPENNFCKACANPNVLPAKSKRTEARERSRSEPVDVLDVRLVDQPRISTCFPGLDASLGGGLVVDSAVLIFGDPGIGKCCHVSTRVVDPVTGAYGRLGDRAHNPGHVVSLDQDTLCLVPVPVARFIPNGIKPLVRVVTALGRELRVTAEHPFLTWRGWLPASALRKGDRLASPTGLPFFGAREMPEEEIRLIAYLLGDGSTLDGKVSVAASLPEIVRDMYRIAAHFGCRISDYGKPGNASREYRVVHEHGPQENPALEYVRALGMGEKAAARKSIPACIFELRRPLLTMFLHALFSTDGSVNVSSDDQQPKVSYATTSRCLAEEVQHLLLRFGFVARLRTKPSTYKGEPYTSYEVEFMGVPEVKRFLDEIGLDGRDEAQARIAGLPDPGRPSTRSDTIPTGQAFWDRVDRANAAMGDGRRLRLRCGVQPGDRKGGRADTPLARTTVCRMADSLRDPWLDALAHGDVYWDEVVEEAVPAGEGEVGDLEVPPHADFVAGDLVIHNSTVLMQLAANFVGQHLTVLYVTGEESQTQVASRAIRLGLRRRGVHLLESNSLAEAAAAIRRFRPNIVIADSAQTISDENVSGAEGAASQIRAVASTLGRLCKQQRACLIMVGHVNKEGGAAGPKTLEHLVDVLVLLLGQRAGGPRTFLPVKNRFGPSGTPCVLEMGPKGLTEVQNAAVDLLGERAVGEPGSVVYVDASMTVPMLVEIEALVARNAAVTGDGGARRDFDGVGKARIPRILARLANDATIDLARRDVDISAASISKQDLDDESVDLAIAAAVASSARNEALAPDIVVFGAIGVSGRVKAVDRCRDRLEAALKLGFTRALIPKENVRRHEVPKGMRVCGIATVRDLGTWFDGQLTPYQKRKARAEAARKARKEGPGEGGGAPAGGSTPPAAATPAVP
jgi:DNA repair protein RadA/Sms